MLSLAHINQDLQTESAIAVLSSDIRRFDVGGGVGGRVRRRERITKKTPPEKSNSWFHCGTANTYSSEGIVQIVKSPGNDYNVIDI